MAPQKSSRTSVEHSTAPPTSSKTFAKHSGVEMFPHPEA
jgi:hypothetical protein